MAKIGVLLIFVLGGLFTSVELWLDYNDQGAELEALVNQAVEAASPPAARAIHTLDEKLSAEVVNGLLAYKFIYEVSILDETGEALARGNRSRHQWAVGGLAEKLMPSSKTYIAPLALPGFTTDVSGTLILKVDLTAAMQGFYQRSFMAIVVGGLRNSLLLIFLLTAFYFFLTSPLIRMVKEIEAIHPTRPRQRRLSVPHVSQQDELTHLAVAGNGLLDAVEGAFQQRREVELALRESEQAIRLIINQLPAIVGLLNMNGRVAFANHNLADFLGGTPESVIGWDVTKFGFSLSRAKYICVDTDSRTIKDTDAFEGFYTSANKTRHYLQGHMKSIMRQGEALILLVANDISERKAAEDKMQFMAYHDALTSLPNRAQLVERLEHEIARSRRHKYYGAILFIDLDNFKNINDSLGHPVGDTLLKEVATRLTQSVRGEDIVARLSGDEFVVVLTVLDQTLNTAGIKAGEVAEKIRKRLAEPYPHQDFKLHVTCSIGVVLFNDKDTSVHELLRYADTAMYQSKHKGRDTIEFFNAVMADKVSLQLQMEGELHRAIEEEQFELYWQPKVSISSGRIEGAEALLRWMHPVKGMVSPAEFIPVLESCGLMVDVGRWVIAEGCRQVQHLCHIGLWQTGMRLSLNVSPRQFRGQTFVDDMAATLKDISIPPNSIDLEITEGVVIQNIEDTINTMSTLAEMGISVSLDDFGTGYSSISYLKRLPVNTLKVDYSFVRDIVEDRSDRVLVETIVTMAHLLGLRVVAEGVETQTQLDVLKGFGCHSYQGYFFSRPLPIDEFASVLIRNQHDEQDKLSF